MGRYNRRAMLHSRARRLAGAAILLVLAAIPAAAQLRIGQYEDEAPLRSWNAFPSVSAAGLGRGTVALAWAEDGTAAWSNPALLAFLPRPTLTLNGSIQAADFYRFSLVNTGPILSDGPLTAASSALDAAAVSFRAGAWALAAACGAWEIYDRPAASVESFYRGRRAYALDFNQEGRLWAASLAAARRLGRSLSLGFSLHILWGGLRRGYVEDWAASGFTIVDDRETDFRGFVPQAGLAWDVSSTWTLGLSVRPAWTKKGRSRARIEFLSSQVPGGILQEEEWDDSLGQPWVVGLGAACRLLPGLRLAADAIWFDWSGYAPSLYGGPAERGFQDVVRLSAGAEYQIRLRLFGAELLSPLRAGLVYDPQPMRDPRSAYVDLSVGSGFEWRGIRLDVGVLAGRESGSGSGLTVRRVGLGLSARL